MAETSPSRRSGWLIAAGLTLASPALAQQAAAPKPAPSPGPVQLIPGQPIETRVPELDGDKPAFAGQTRAPYRPTVKVAVTTVATGLNYPWSLAFLPGGKFLVTEKPGALRIVDAAGKIGAPVSGLPAVLYKGQVGLLDVVLDPRFAATRRIYFSYMEPVGSDSGTIAIARATLDVGANALADVRVIFRANPAVPLTQSGNAGGRIVIARDGTLFATIGDRTPPRAAGWMVAQQLDKHLGKIVHITANGAPAPGNPFIGAAGALPEIWSYGHRSEQGIAIDSRGRLWEMEHGPRGGDELNLILPGRNYGWPVIAHGKEYGGDLINGGKTEQAGMEQPRYYWDPVIAPSGFAFYTGKLFPQWRDSILVGALRGQMLDRLTLRGDKVVDEEPLLLDLKKRIRDVRVARDGAVYVLTDEAAGQLLKLTPQRRR